MTTEMGKTLASAKAEVAKCATALPLLRRARRRRSSPTSRPTPAAVGAQPGLRRATSRSASVLAVMPWNFPLWQVMRFAAPALMAGNVGLLKHAANVPQTALYLEELFRRAGFPAGAFQTLLIGSDEVEQVLSDDRRVAAATLTGSEPAGQSVAAIAGRRAQEDRARARRQRPVRRDAVGRPGPRPPRSPSPRAARTTASAASRPSGSSCTRTSPTSSTQLFAERDGRAAVGDPMDEDTDVGPLATEQGRDDVEELVADAVGKGATVLVGGQRAGRPGLVLPADPGHRASRRRCGCTARRSSARSPRCTASPDLDAAIELANATRLRPRLQRLDRRPGRAGAVRPRRSTPAWCSSTAWSTSYPELPFGGVKHSGYGRELTDLGMREFMNVKTVWIG